MMPVTLLRARPKIINREDTNRDLLLVRDTRSKGTLLFFVSLFSFRNSDDEMTNRYPPQGYDAYAFFEFTKDLSCFLLSSFEKICLTFSVQLPAATGLSARWIQPRLPASVLIIFFLFPLDQFG